MKIDILSTGECSFTQSHIGISSRERATKLPEPTKAKTIYVIEGTGKIMVGNVVHELKRRETFPISANQEICIEATGTFGLSILMTIAK